MNALVSLFFAAGVVLSARPLDKALYPKRVDVAGPIELRWDLTKPGEQRWRATIDATGGADVHLETDLILVVPASSTTANVMIDKAQATVTKQGKSQKFEAPLAKVGALRSDGTLVAEEDNSPVRALFALPAGPLRVGDTVTIPFDVAMKLQGRTVVERTAITMKLARVVHCSKNRCAQLEWSFAAQRTSPELSLEARGAGVTYFDLDAHRLVAADVFFEVALHPKDSDAHTDHTDQVNAQFARFRPRP